MFPMFSPGYSLFTGLNEEADARLSSASKKLQSQASQAACTATGACTAPKVPSPAADSVSPAESIGATAEGRAGAPALGSSAPSPAAGPVPAAGNQEQAAQAM